jgi:hypothetical protein
MTPEEFVARHPLAAAAYERVSEIVHRIGPFEARASKSQVAFRRRRGFAYLWLPGQYLTRPDADVVLSIALSRKVESSRWKEVVQPSTRRWMHHLELTSADDIDREVEAWLAEAAASAG